MPMARSKPESVRDVEIGLKTDWSLVGIKGRTNLALFDSRCTDAQVLTAAVIAGSPQGLTANAAKATIKGVEVENVLRLTDHVELNLSYSRLDAAYDKYITPLGADLTGTQYPYAPREKAAGGGRLRLPLASTLGEVWLGATYSYQSSVYVGITAFGGGISPANTQPRYGLLNVRAEWNRIFGSRADLAVFVSNATDKVYETTVEDLYNATGASVATFGEPRTVAATLSYQF